MYDIKSPASVQRWMRQEKELKLEVGNNNKKGKEVTSNTTKNYKVHHPEMEIILESWIRDERLKGKAVTGKDVMKMAKSIVDDSFGNDSGFKASRG